MTNAATASIRDASGRFVPGQSGNPAGRPKGARNRATVFAEFLAEGEAGVIVRRYIQRALDGDPVALRVCFERLVAKAGPAPVQLDLEPGAESDPGAVVTAAIRGMADGEVTPHEAAAIARVAVAAKKVLGAGRAMERRVVPAAAEAAEATMPGGEEKPSVAESEAAVDATPVIRLYPVPAEAATGSRHRAFDAPGVAPQGAAMAAATPVSGQYPAAPAWRDVTLRSAARG